jgi:branched-chain amino acid transport system substrate-binding protein
VARALSAICISALVLAGCAGGDGDDRARIRGEVATVYVSAPRHGVSAADGAAVLAGARRALSERGGRAGELRIRMREVSATEDAGRAWDPAHVAANAERAAGDPDAIAYLGELDHGATAISLPVTNEAGVLQVSPGDGLTSLTQRVPGRPRAGPERHYPSGVRSFVRLGPTDLLEAEAIVARLMSAGANRIALVSDGGIYGGELAAQVASRARRAGLDPVASEQYGGEPDTIPDLARELAEAGPDAVIHTALRSPATVPLLTALADALPEAQMYATSGILAGGNIVIPAGLAGLGAFGPALSPEEGGYEAMRLVLDAVREGGRDRERVIGAALRLARERRDDRIALYRPDRGGRLQQVEITR